MSLSVIIQLYIFRSAERSFSRSVEAFLRHWCIFQSVNVYYANSFVFLVKLCMCVSCVFLGRFFYFIVSCVFSRSVKHLSVSCVFLDLLSILSVSCVFLSVFFNYISVSCIFLSCVALSQSCIARTVQYISVSQLRIFFYFSDFSRSQWAMEKH